MLNTQLHSPTVVTETLAYDVDLQKASTLRGLWINAAGRTFVVDIHGKAASFVTETGNLPVYVDLQIKRIVGDGAGAVGNGTTGTNVAIADLVGVNG